MAAFHCRNGLKMATSDGPFMADQAAQLRPRTDRAGGWELCGSAEDWVSLIITESATIDGGGAKLPTRQR